MRARRRPRAAADAPCAPTPACDRAPCCAASGGWAGVTLRRRGRRGRGRGVRLWHTVGRKGRQVLQGWKVTRRRRSRGGEQSGWGCCRGRLRCCTCACGCCRCRAASSSAALRVLRRWVGEGGDAVGGRQSWGGTRAWPPSTQTGNQPRSRCPHALPPPERALVDVRPQLAGLGLRRRLGRLNRLVDLALGLLQAAVGAAERGPQAGELAGAGGRRALLAGAT